MLVPAAAVALAGIGLWLAWGRLAALGRSEAAADAQIREALANQVRASLEDVYGFRGGGTLDLHPVRYADVAPLLEGERAVVTAMLEAEGRAVWREQVAAVSYLGRERFHMRPCSIALWCAEGDQFARLRSVLAFLFRRHDALAAAARPAARRVLAWQIRAERETAEVGEDLETAPPTGAPTRERSRLSLRLEGGRWVAAGR
ncbi:MAG TPA: nuclear transport factor 2 family protein [Anaeromyxobacteraceae bacterium]